MILLMSRTFFLNGQYINRREKRGTKDASIKTKRQDKQTKPLSKTLRKSPKLEDKLTGEIKLSQHILSRHIR